jgi:hypothetical protein
MSNTAVNVGQKEFRSQAAAAAADIATKTVYVRQIHICNPTAGSITVSLLTKDTVPVTLLEQAVAADTTPAPWVFPDAIKFTNGITVAVSGAGAILTVFGYIDPTA